MAYFFLSQDTTVRDEPSSSLTFQLVIPATNRENESEQVTSSKSYAGDSDFMSQNTKHLDTKFLCLFFFLASYADVSKHPDVLPDITQTTLCHILLNDLVPWRHSLHWVEISVKIEPMAGTLTYAPLEKTCEMWPRDKSRRETWDVQSRQNPTSPESQCASTDPHNYMKEPLSLLLWSFLAMLDSSSLLRIFQVLETSQPELTLVPFSTMCGHVQSLQSCLTLFNPMDCSLPISSIHEIFQTRIL